MANIFVFLPKFFYSRVVLYSFIFSILSNQQLQFKMSDIHALINSRPGRNFQLKFAQQRYTDLECSLNQRVHCIQIQLKNILAYSTGQKQTVDALIAQAQQQIQSLIKFYYDAKMRETKKLLAKQTIIQQQAQLKDIIRQYEDRIYEMGCNLYTKQVDISVDHVGKLSEQKPVLNRVRLLNKIKTQVSNIENFLDKACTLRKNVKRLSKNQQNLDNNEIVQRKQSKFFMQALRIPNQSLIFEKHQQKDRICSAVTKQSSTDSSQSNPEVQKKSKGRRMLLLGSQCKIYQKRKQQADPQLLRMVQLLKIQKQREKKARNQYDQLKNKYASLCMQNRELASQYRISINKDKKLIQSLQSSDN